VEVVTLWPVLAKHKPLANQSSVERLEKPEREIVLEIGHHGFPRIFGTLWNAASALNEVIDRQT
jgi:hypothetical protein